MTKKKASTRAHSGRALSQKKSVARKATNAKSTSANSKTTESRQKHTGSESTGGLDKALLLKMHDLMVKSRVLEERLIQIYKMGEAFFWIGGPGEEAFGVALGLLTNKGQGKDHDYLHLHYRCTPTLIALGMPMIDGIRLIMNRATDVSTGGRNFAGHYCYPQWNVLPVTSPIEVQYATAIGTAWAQHRDKSKGITVVTGGDAGTAEGEFASCLVWSSRPGNELPMLITVQNNRWGISTSYETQHGEKSIADRGKAFGMRTAVYDCNDPIEAYVGLQDEFEYIRKTGKPSLVECSVSRLNGHSSATGAARVTEETDCLRLFEEKLLQLGYLKEAQVKKIWGDYDKEAKEAVKQVRAEPAPDPATIWDHTYVGDENADWRKF